MSETKSTALARVEDPGALAMVMAPSEAVQRLKELQAFVKEVMVEGEDYGTIPGMKGKKNDDGTVEPPRKVLKQPGAQKLAEIYGLAITFENERAPIETWDGADPFFAYFKRAVVTRRRDGLFLGAGLGSCNSREKKYAARWVFDRDVPAGMDKAKLPRKDGEGKNGRPYVMYRVPNPEIFDLVNTLEKMACKRALVHAVIAVTRSSGLFTQDLEDMATEARGNDAAPEVHDAEFIEDAPPPPRAPTAAEIVAQARKAQTVDEAQSALAALKPFGAKARAEGWFALARVVPSGEVAAVRALAVADVPGDRFAADFDALVAGRQEAA